QRYTAASAIAETADRLSAEEGEPVLKLYLLVVGALRALAETERDSSLVLDAFFLRAMAYAGWAPALTECARCGLPGPHSAFNVAAGGAMCQSCRIPGCVHPAPEVLDLLTALLHGEWPHAEATLPGTRRDASGLVAAHLQWHLERQLRSLPLVERRPREAPAPGQQGRGDTGSGQGGVLCCAGDARRRRHGMSCGPRSRTRPSPGRRRCPAS